MSDYSFSDAQKVSIWRADGEKCFYCRIPIQYTEIQIDHIVPEGIPPRQFAELQPKLPSNFEINSIPNWVTCHQGCNIRKSVYVFETPTLLYFVGMAGKRADKVQKNLDGFEVQKQNGNLLSTLRVRVEKGHLSVATVLATLGDIQVLRANGSDPWLITFGANFLDALPADAPERDPELSDWLLGRLDRDLATTGAVFRRVDDDRSGKDISVRYAFWNCDLDRIRQDIDFCWDVLGVHKFSEVFQSSADELLDRAVVSRYHEIVHNVASDDPIGISACPKCGATDFARSSISNEEDTYYELKCRECGHTVSS
jgi:predicted RNA-binding Zn-ribbon protein involved in translation (DUF1610 family)